MTIDEAIKFCYEKAWDIKLKTEPQTFLDIAEWLEELKALKEKEEKFDRNIKFFEKIQWESCKAGYNKGIEDFVTKLKEETFNGYVTLEDYFEDSIECVAVEDIVMIAEQLKAGDD